MGQLHAVLVRSGEESQTGSDQSQSSAGAGCFVVHTAHSKNSEFLCVFYGLRIARDMEEGIVSIDFLAG